MAYRNKYTATYTQIFYFIEMGKPTRINILIYMISLHILYRWLGSYTFNIQQYLGRSVKNVINSGNISNRVSQKIETRFNFLPIKDMLAMQIGKVQKIS